MIKQSNYRAALDAATAFCLHIGRKRSGASERGCYAPAVQRSPSRLPSSRSCLWPVFGFPKRWVDTLGHRGVRPLRLQLRVYSSASQAGCCCCCQPSLGSSMVLLRDTASA